MGELNFGEAEIEDFGDSVSDENTDASKETVEKEPVDENDKLEDFPAEVAGWPDPGFPLPGP